MHIPKSQPLQIEPGLKIDTNLDRVHQQWVATLDAVRDAIVVVDDDGRITRANRGFAELDELKSGTGHHYNPAVVKALNNVVGALDTFAPTLGSGGKRD
ncbi:MAG: sensor histidine kinase regulating citrate/malate metabolism [Gammaproteobacteria bacterium]|jgi:sensor histidine kinase regulating citrate/malate metabolism